jgi:hypothetical protein
MSGGPDAVSPAFLASNTNTAVRSALIPERKAGHWLHAASLP